MGSVSFGLQIGGQSATVIMMVMSERGLAALYATSAKLGAGVSVAVGPVGAGAEGATAQNFSADMVSFSRCQGAFVGVSLAGSIITTNDDWNRDYYGKELRPVQILVNHEVSNPGARPLIGAVEQLVNMEIPATHRTSTTEGAHDRENAPVQR
jgi:lipid-binding SYLF domain-containing protein